MRKMWKKTLSLLVSLCMVITMMPAVAWAENTCAHVHNTECGYVMAKDCQHECSIENGCITVNTVCVHDCTVGTGCLTLNCEEEHEHGDGCYATACTHTECTEATGCVTKTTSCQHGDNHDSDCGYVAGVACTHVCANPCVADGKLDIAYGSIIITETGYAQGIHKFTDRSGYSVVDEEGNAVEEIPYTGEITLSGTNIATAADSKHVIIVEGKAAAPTGNETPLTITLDDVCIDNTSAGNYIPAFVLMSGYATLDLEGENVLVGAPQAPAVQINKDATLTIDGDGSLDARSSNHTAGIGVPRNNAFAINPNNGRKDNAYRSGGNLIIESGTINAYGAGAGAGIGASHGLQFGDVTINGGTVTVNSLEKNSNAGINTCTNAAGGGDITINGGKVNVTINGANFAAIGGGSNGANVCAGDVTITGGEITINVSKNKNAHAIRTGGDFEMTGGTLVELKRFDATKDYITANSVSISGGNVKEYYTEDISGYKLTELYIVDAEGNPVTTEATIENGSHEWSALPDENGVITTYLAENTSKLIYGGTAYDVVPGMKNTIGVTCQCADGASIVWSDVPDEIEVYKNLTSRSISVSAEFAKAANCLAPAHPVEAVLTVANDAADLTDGVLTLEYKNSGDYTITLNAVAGALASDTKTISVKCVTEAGFDLSAGSVTVEKDGDAVVYIQGVNEYRTTSEEKVVFTGTSSENNIEINTDATIVLRDLSLTNIKAKSPIKLTGNATLNLWLEGKNTLTTGAYNQNDGVDVVNNVTTSAIFVESGSTLIIDSEDGTLKNSDIDAAHYGDKQQGYAGSLLAKTDETIRGGASAIGGDYFADPNMACGNITIKGGNVTAQATLASNKRLSGSAIGSGYTGHDGSDIPDAVCGDITIEGGNIRALAAEGSTTPGRAISSGIGDLTITGGVIYASAPNDGWNGDSAGSIYSHKGTLTIGTENGDDGDLYIYAGTTMTDVGQGDNAAPAIGVSSGGTLNILSGTITAESTGNGPAIGVAPYAPVTEDPVKLNIAGGSIDLILADESQAGTSAAIGIGGNNYDNPIEINISGGSIESDKLNIGVRGNQDSTVNISGDAQVNIANGNLVGDLNVSDEADVTIGGDVKGIASIAGGSTINDKEIPESVASVTVPEGKLGEVSPDEAGNITLPAGSVVILADGTVIMLPDGGVLNADGTVTIGEGGTVEQADGTEITLGGGGSLGTDGAVTMYEGTATIEKDGETTTVVIPEDAEGTVNGSTVTLPTGSTVTLPDGTSTTVSNGGSVNLENGTVTQNKTPSAGYRPSSKRYSVSIDAKNIENGSVKLSNSSAKKGATVTITVTPDAGYMLDKLTVTDKDGNKLALKNLGNGKYSFTMPRGGVEVDASFKEFDGSEPSVDTKETAIVLTIDSTLILIDDEYVVNDVAPIIRGERTVLPIRVIAEALGATVTWNEVEQTVTIMKGDITIVLYIGQAFALVNGDPVQLDAPAFIENGRTYLPLRFIMENLGASVVWDGLTRTVTIIG